MKELEELALKFSKGLVEGKYEESHALLTSANQLIWPASWLKKEYEEMIEYGDGPPTYLEVMQTDPMNGWASFKEGDIGYVYVSIMGDGYSEAVALIFKNDSNQTRIREITWGRP